MIIISTINLLYRDNIEITDKIKIRIPTVGDIVDHEDEYYTLVSVFTAMPIDMMVQLNDIGIDFTAINEYELFLLMFDGIKNQDTSLLFVDLDLKNFKINVDTQTGEPKLVDSKNGIVIDKKVYFQISDLLRRINNIEKNKKKPANKEAKEFMIQLARKKATRQKRRKNESQIETLIVAMVNAEQYKYDFEGSRRLSIYQFNESVRQVIKKVDYNNKMYGVYTGNIKPKDLSQEDLNWLIHK